MMYEYPFAKYEQEYVEEQAKKAVNGSTPNIVSFASIVTLGCLIAIALLLI